MPLGLGLGITKLKSLVSGLRVRFQGNATITAALDGILRDLSADFVSNGTVTAALEAIKLLDVDFSGDGTLTADLASFTGLLDDYPNAAAAYSIRLLKSDYTGALVRIRKDTAGQPEKDFYPDSNNELSLNSSDGGTTLGSWIGSNDGYIVTWYDQSGNSNDATQSSASAQPQIVSSGSLISEGGKAAIDFDQTNTVLSTASNVDFGLNTSIFGVFTPDVAATGFDVVCKLGADSSGNRRTFALFSGDIYASAFANNLNIGAFSTGVQYIARQYAESNEQYGAVNGASLVSGTFSLNNPPSGTITIGSSTLSEFFGGTVQEIIMYNSTQRSNDTEINDNITNFF